MKLYIIETYWGLHDESYNNIVGVFNDPIVADTYKRKLQSHVDYIIDIFKHSNWNDLTPEETPFTKGFNISVKEIELNEILNYTNILCK